MSDSEDDVPLAARAAPAAPAAPVAFVIPKIFSPGAAVGVKRALKEAGSDSDDDVPLGARPPAAKVPRVAAAVVPAAKPPPSSSKKAVVKPKPVSKPLPKASKPAPKKRKAPSSDDEDESSDGGDDDEEEEDDDDEEEEGSSDDDEPISSLLKKAKPKATKKAKAAGGGKKLNLGNDEPWTVKKGAKKMWTTLSHAGVVFPPAYETHGIPLVYDGKDVKLLPHEEEVCTFFAVMKDTDYAIKPVFIKNFFDGFKKVLKGGPHKHVTDFSKCDFTKIYLWDLARREKNKAITTDEKKKAKAEKEAAEEHYVWATIDDVREKVGNYRVEPPGLFRGRGEHPKMGRIKARILPEDITINIGRDAPVPVPLPGHKWKQVIHNDTVTWLAGWHDTINTKDWKYVQFGATSAIKSSSDMQKYEKARALKLAIDVIRRDYLNKMKSGSALEQQLAVTTYLVDKLALRAGGEKEEDLADTVGVCTLRKGHVEFLPPSTLKLDFLGKDSIRYLQEHEVDPLVFDAMQKFCKGKKPDHDIFDQIDPTKVNKHLQSLMPGLTIKVFRTYNASYTLNKLLKETTDTSATVAMKKAVYDAANKEVAVLCNHQKGVGKSFDAQMEKLVDKKKGMEKELADLKKDKSEKGKSKVESMKERLGKLELQMKMKDELKTVSLGTSKINYLDPRITLAWCKQHEVPPPTVYTRALVEKFNWAMEVEPDFDF